MDQLGYLPSAQGSRAIQAADLHLKTWSIVFYVISGALVLTMAWVAAVRALAGVEAGVSNAGLMLALELLIPSCLIGGAAFVFWALGKRCGDARRALQLRHALDFQWAVKAFAALMVFSFMGVVTGWLVFASSFAGRLEPALIVVVFCLIWFPLLLMWSYFRILRAASEIARPL